MSSVMVPHTVDGKYKKEIKQLADGLQTIVDCVLNRADIFNGKYDRSKFNTEFVFCHDWKSTEYGIKLMSFAELDASNVNLFLQREWSDSMQSPQFELTDLGEFVFVLVDLMAYCSFMTVQMPLNQYIILNRHKTTLDKLCAKFQNKK